MSYLRPKPYPTVFTVCLVIFLSISRISFSQEACGTQISESLALSMQLLPDFGPKQRLGEDSVTFLALKIHLVQNDSNYSDLEIDDVLKEMEEVNEFFKAANLQFYIYDSINYISDSDLYTYEIANDEFALKSFAEPNVINVFFVKSINASTSAFGGYTYLPPGPDIVFMSHNSTLFAKTILAHELGHYFGLYHTHGISNWRLTDELVDGSNCSTAGDRICDTPADPNVIGKVDFDCTYTGNLTDRNGDKFMPDTKNIMSYSLDKCCEYFSEGQFERMLEVLKIYRGNIISYKQAIDTGSDDIKIEAENHFQVVEERGNKSNILVFGGAINDDDEGKAVTLFDKGDKLKIGFNIQETGDYLIRARLRSGFSSNPTRYWPGGYFFEIDSESVILNGDTTSLSPLYTSFGGAHWGNMEAVVYDLAKGEHFISVMSNLDWAALDYIEVERIVKQKILQVQKIEIEDSFFIIDEKGSKSDIKVLNESVDDSEQNIKIVSLFDKGDKIGVGFSLDKKAKYNISLTLRSGYRGNETRYWPDGYRFSLDSAPINLVGDTTTLSPFYQSLGGSHWGAMSTEKVLDSGTHLFTIEAKLDWSAVDYIYVTELENNNPTDILLSNNAVEENNLKDAFIGLLNTLDLDEHNVHNYQFVEGDGDEDNEKFFISNDSIFSKVIFDYEEKTEHSIRVQANDGYEGIYTKVFKIDVLNVYDSYVDFTILELNHVYDGTPKGVKVISEPAGINYNLRYNGSDSLPINAGVYTIKVNSENPEYAGEQTATMHISKAEAVIDITGLEQAYDGNAKQVSVITAPLGLQFEITYVGMDTLPTEIGEYDVNIKLAEQNYKGDTTAKLFIKDNRLAINDSLNTEKPNSRISKSSLTSNISNDPQNTQLIVYPNPTQGILTLEDTSLDEEQASIMVFDTKGGFLESYLRPSYQNKIAIDFTNYVPGIYFVYFIKGEKIEVLKISRL